MTRQFWIMTFLGTFLASGLLQLFSVIEIGLPAQRPRLPVPGHEYVSATRDGQTDHSLFYFDMFGFGRRLKEAEVLVAGSSHAEFGIEAGGFNSHARAFNMALGGGETVAFAAVLLDRYKASPNLLVVDPFSADRGMSAEASTVMGLSREDAYLRVFEIWAGFVRDWIILGFLPRLTLRPWHVTFEQPINAVVIRDWRTADVRAFYANEGEIFADPAMGHAPSFDEHSWTAIKPDDASARSFKATARARLVTTIPYPAFDEDVAKNFAHRIEGGFISVAPDNLTYYDYHHLNAAGRAIATMQLREAAE